MMVMLLSHGGFQVVVILRILYSFEDKAGICCAVHRFVTPDGVDLASVSHNQADCLKGFQLILSLLGACLLGSLLLCDRSCDRRSWHTTPQSPCTSCRPHSLDSSGMAVNGASSRYHLDVLLITSQVQRTDDGDAGLFRNVPSAKVT